MILAKTIPRCTVTRKTNFRGLVSSTSIISSSCKPRTQHTPQRTLHISKKHCLQAIDKDTVKTLATDEEQSPKAIPLQLLPRPLGVREKPRWTPLSIGERKDAFLDQEARKEREKILMKLSSEAYYSDVHKMSFHAGKRWIAPEQLIKEERSLYFPNLSGKTLGPSPRYSLADSPELQKRNQMEYGPLIPTTNGNAHAAQIAQGNVSIIAIVNSQISHEQIKAWTASVAEKWRPHERFRLITVNVQQNPLRTFLVSFFTSRLKQGIPRQFHQSYIISYDNVDFIRDAIGLENKFVGHVYLVDWQGRIRWAGCGDPWVGDEHTHSGHRDSHMGTRLPEGGPGGQVMEGVVQGLGEVQRLERCLNVLMNRLDTLIQAKKV
ncbi:Mitochondrial ATPase complex subunit atp10 [Serendipita sp. 401]|nr:Mitochondrial ATPase complex subunit atp10 [Serendipita sp. 401]